MTIAFYETKGHLTDQIPADRIADAQAYLLGGHEGEPLNMEQYLDEPLRKIVVDLRWELSADGYNYTVRATCKRPLTDDEQRALSLEVSGQNSDGHGENFEQQDFAWLEDGECGECDGCINWDSCDDETGKMISFDWQENELPWTRVK